MADSEAIWDMDYAYVGKTRHIHDPVRTGMAYFVVPG
jgi:hypothetical protein